MSNFNIALNGSSYVPQSSGGTQAASSNSNFGTHSSRPPSPRPTNHQQHQTDHEDLLFMKDILSNQAGAALTVLNGNQVDKEKLFCKSLIM
jgi:hypothetical protein